MLAPVLWRFHCSQFRYQWQPIYRAQKLLNTAVDTAMSDSQHDAAPGMCPPRLQPCNSRNQVCRVAAHSPPRRTRGPSGHLLPHASCWWRSVPASAPLPSTGGDPGREGQPGKRPLRSVQGVLRAGSLLPGNVRVTPARVASHPVKCMTTDTPRPTQHLWSGRDPA